MSFSIQYHSWLFGHFRHISLNKKVGKTFFRPKVANSEQKMLTWCLYHLRIVFLIKLIVFLLGMILRKHNFFEVKLFITSNDRSRLYGVDIIQMLLLRSYGKSNYCCYITNFLAISLVMDNFRTVLVSAWRASTKQRFK